MITPQDIKEKTFEKAVFGGYSMAEVDTFLETISDDLTLLIKENATLKAKMKVLVDKVEEYRSNEDAIRMAVVSAQRLGNIIEGEARDKATALLAQATEESERISREAQLAVELEKTRLEEAKRSSALFVENMELLCNRQLNFLGKVNEMDFIRESRGKGAEEAAPATAEAAAAPESAGEGNEIHETVKSIEETIAKVADEPVSVVHPVIPTAPAVDELPTRAFGIVTAPEDDLEKTVQFSFDGFEK